MFHLHCQTGNTAVGLSRTEESNNNNIKYVCTNLFYTFRYLYDLPKQLSPLFFVLLVIFEQNIRDKNNGKYKNRFA